MCASQFQVSDLSHSLLLVYTQRSFETDFKLTYVKKDNHTVGIFNNVFHDTKILLQTRQTFWLWNFTFWKDFTNMELENHQEDDAKEMFFSI